MDFTDFFANGVNNICVSTPPDIERFESEVDISLPAFSAGGEPLVVKTICEILKAKSDDIILSHLHLKTPIQLTGEHVGGADILKQLGFPPYAYYTHFPEMADDLNKRLSHNEKIALFGRLSDMAKYLHPNSSHDIVVLQEKGFCLDGDDILVSQAFRITDYDRQITDWIVTEFVYKNK